MKNRILVAVLIAFVVVGCTKPNSPVPAPKANSSSTVSSEKTVTEFLDPLEEAGNADPMVLANRIMNADEKQFARIFAKFKEHGEPGLSFLIHEIDREVPSDVPSSDEKREKLAKRQANAAVALLRMNQPAKVWPLLKHSPDPRVRSYLIHRFGPLGADVGSIIKRLDEEPDITICRALILSLGEFGESEFAEEDRNTLLPKLREMYLTESDAGIHAACEWLLRRWEDGAWLKQSNEEWSKDDEKRENRLKRIGNQLTNDKEQMPHWFINSQGQTMVVIPGPVEFVMGSPTTERERSEIEPQHKRRIGRTFAIASKSVTVEQYRNFNEGYPLPEIYTRTAELPMVRMSWHQAAAYCNLLSEEEGLAECYEIVGQTARSKDDYLYRTGYRLPTEAEMEYVTRAGAVTARCYGESIELLPKYAWYENSERKTQPVGSLKPNDFGLFDVLGNVWTWCQESESNYFKINGTGVTDDEIDILVARRGKYRVIRGCSWGMNPFVVRSACRVNVVPTCQWDSNGFRLARTLPPIPHTSLPPSADEGEIKNNE